MKIGVVTTPNTKGQIVIPKDMRKALGITQEVPLHIVLRGNGIYITPVKEIITLGDTESAYLKILAKTRGSWSGDDWPATERKREIIERKAASKRKKQW